MSTLTDANMKALEAVTTEAGWSQLCLDIKKEHGGYPSDWFARVNQSGLMARVAARFGKDAEIHLVAVHASEGDNVTLAKIGG